MNKKLLSALTLIFVCISLGSFAQGSDCSTATPFCTGTTYNFPNTTGQGDGGTYGCLGTTPNQAWYYLQIDNSGNIDIHIEQTSTSGSGIDVDFICWGPFTNLTNACAIDFTSTPDVDCSYSPDPTEDCNIPSAVSGQFYILLLTNFSDQLGNIEFSQTGGTGSTDCGVLCTAPNASAGGPQALTCLITTVNLTGNSTTPGVTYQWNGPGGFSSTSQNPTVSTAGTYTLTVTDPANSACPSTAQQVVTMNNTPPSVSVGGPQDITCLTTTATISGSSTAAGATFSWAGPGGFTSSAASASVTTAGTYTLTVSDPGNGCVDSAFQVVNVNNTPPNAAAGSPEELTCTITSINLTSNSTTPGATYSWAGPGGFTGTGTSPAVTVAGTYSLTVTDSTNGCTATAQQDITSNTMPPDASAGAPQMLDCASTSLTINGASVTPGAMYSWNGPFGYTSALQSPSVNIAGTYTLTVTDPVNGCSDTAHQVVNQNINAPNVSTDSTQLITCATSVVNLTGASTTTNVEFSWAGPAGFTSTLANPVTSTVGTYTLTVTDTISGCISYAQQSVAIDTLPPGATTGGALFVSCIIDTVYLSGSASSLNAVYSWSGPGTFTSSLQNPAATEGGTYTLTVTDTINGCTSIAQQIVNSDTTAPSIIVGADQMLTCTVLTANLNGNSTSPDVVFNWSGPGGFTSTSISPTVSAIGSYILTVTDTINGCTSAATQTVASNTTPPAVTPGTMQFLTCISNSATLSAVTTVPGATYSWTGPGGFTSASATPVTTLSGTYAAVVTDSANGCSTTVNQLVGSNTTPPPSNAGPSQSIFCGETTLAISGASPAGGPYLYNWTTSNGNIYSGGNTLSPVVDSGTYVLTVTDTINGCSSSSSVVVDQMISPVADFTATPSSGPAPLFVSFTNMSMDNNINFWVLSNNDSITITNPSSVYNTPGAHPVTLYVVSIDGCVDSLTLTVTVDELSALVVPNVFTPNGDGYNDWFKPVVAKSLTEFNAAIYDRWGLKMFEWTDEKSSGWDGRAKSGKQAPDGTYMYIITGKGVDGKTYDFKGHVQLFNN